jgi:hypothetical protein
MKHFVMTRPKQPSEMSFPHSLRDREPAEAAFDLWLQRSLHQLFDSVAKEPIPEELMRLIEDDQRE